MQIGALTEQEVGRWAGLLDADETARAQRFVFPRHRIQYVAAHALTRKALGHAMGVDPAAWRWAVGEHGKPSAQLGGAPAAVSFNLSHAEGVVGVAVLAQAGADVGFDIEPLDRVVDLAVADRYFRAEETAWLAGLPAGERRRGFMRLWTLKEAFIKATGEGLSRDLSSFWFEIEPVQLHLGDGSPESAWHFEQRVLAGGFVAAAGARTLSGGTVPQVWTEIDPAAL
ncbi:MAG: 4'-phosphopantetheinyl transferase superfamily protein [Proteobacteria bacterium]|nr:4'-phosphopantetheinyl transferase superfamily protein [Pseudomonadota bacterium]